MILRKRNIDWARGIEKRERDWEMMKKYEIMNFKERWFESEREGEKMKQA